MTTFTIVPAGPFALRESVEFGFGQRHAERFDGVMRLAFVLDDRSGAVGVEVSQDAAGVHGTVHGGPGDRTTDAVRAQVARVLSLDADAHALAEIGRADPVVERLLAVAPGLRPPLFHSPYEAALWSVLSARRPARQMAQVRDELALAHGRSFEVAGRIVAAVPTPGQLLRVREFPGIAGEKMTRLHAVARAAEAGWLDVGRLRSLGPPAATSELQRLKGIGPFYASLIVIRSVGFTDVLPREEPLLRGLVGELYQLDGPASPEQLSEIAEAWRPLRTWISVLIRAATPRLPERAGAGTAL